MWSPKGVCEGRDVSPSKAPSWHGSSGSEGGHLHAHSRPLPPCPIQVWKYPKVWEGFIKCCQRTKPQSFQVILQLPPQQLGAVFDKCPELREPLLAHVRSFTPHQVSQDVGWLAPWVQPRGTGGEWAEGSPAVPQDVKGSGGPGTSQASGVPRRGLWVRALCSTPPCSSPSKHTSPTPSWPSWRPVANRSRRPRRLLQGPWRR